MSNEKGCKQVKPKIEKGGYQPLREGYQASNQAKPLTQLPQGGSGESKNSNTTDSGKDVKK